MQDRSASETSKGTSGRPAKIPKSSSSSPPPQPPTTRKQRIGSAISVSREWAARQYDLLLPKVSILAKFIAPIVSTILWLLTIVLGVYLERFYEDYLSTGTIFDWDLMRRNWFLIPIGVVMMILYLIRRTFNHKARRTKQLQDALEWFSEDMGFHKNPDHDVRCTIWAPVGRPKADSTVRMRQLVNYEPRVSPVGHGNTARYKRNGARGRITRVSRHKDGYESPIGILGKTALLCINNNDPVTFIETIDDGVDFQERMIDNWNFSPREAKELSQDRRSYLTISLMDHNRSALLAVLYCDSRNPEALTEDVGNEATKYLPYLGRIITSP